MGRDPQVREDLGRQGPHSGVHKLRGGQSEDKETGAPEVAVKVSPAPSLQRGGSQPTSSEACALQVDSL